MARKQSVVAYREVRKGGRFPGEPVRTQLQLAVHNRKNTIRCAPYTAYFECCFMSNLVNVAICAADAVYTVREIGSGRTNPTNGSN